MSSKRTDEATCTATDDFERRLRRLVLEAFADGASIQGTWSITASSSVVPSWRITVEKVDGADLPDDPAFLDE